MCFCVVLWRANLEEFPLHITNRWSSLPGDHDDQRVRRQRVTTARRHAQALIYLDDVQRRRQCRVNYPSPWPARGRRRHAKGERLAPGVAGDVEVLVRLAAGLAAVEAEGERSARGGKIGGKRLDSVPDDVRRPT